MSSGNYVFFLNAHCMLTVVDLQHKGVNNTIMHSYNLLFTLTSSEAYPES